MLEKINPSIKEILQKALNSEEITPDEAYELLKVTGDEFIALQYAANKLCEEKKNNIVTFVINQNINFTNICEQGCRFCAYSVPGSDNEAFLYSIDDIRQKVTKANEAGCSEVCIQGGINPELHYDYYLDILKTVKDINSDIHIHAFSPQEVFHMSRLKKKSIEYTLKELKNAGLGSMPGTAAEILVDNVRELICPNKVTTEQWVEIISTAHQVGIPTTSTMMYGHIESLKDRITHLEILRNIQKKTNGFTEFVPLVFIRERPILSKLKEYPLQPNYGMADLKLYAVSRLFFNNYIENIQCSWVKLGPKLAQVSLNYGVNDFSGTLMEENISKSAGAEFGEYLAPKEMVSIIKQAGKIPAQRDTLYNTVKKY